VSRPHNGVSSSSCDICRHDCRLYSGPRPVRLLALLEVGPCPCHHTVPQCDFRRHRGRLRVGGHTVSNPDTCFVLLNSSEDGVAKWCTIYSGGLAEGIQPSADPCRRMPSLCPGGRVLPGRLASTGACALLGVFLERHVDPLSSMRDTGCVHRT
jgi:hypothetical protein